MTNTSASVMAALDPGAPDDAHTTPFRTRRGHGYEPASGLPWRPIARKTPPFGSVTGAVRPGDPWQDYLNRGLARRRPGEAQRDTVKRASMARPTASARGL